jgi:hypothetical protein
MSLFEFVIDPASFAGGAVITAIAFGGKTIRARIRANGVAAKSAQLSALFKPQYAELEQKLAAADERISAFSFDYLAAYPSGQKNPVVYFGIQSARDRVRENLNLMLTKLNTLDNSHLSSKEIRDHCTLLENNARLAASGLRDVYTILERYEEKLHISISKIKNLKNDATVIGERLKKAQADYADAVNRFDRLFLESVPPALFKAEKAYETFIEHMNRVIDVAECGGGFVARDSCATERSASIKSLNTLENRLDKVLVFSDVAKAETTKHRAEMRRVNYGSGEQHATDWDAALESLMEAESRPYDKGNPRIEFEETIKPFRIFINNSIKGVYRKR